MHQVGQAAYTSPQNYRDEDGNMKTFTFMDMDKKIKVATHIDDWDREWEPKYRNSVTASILSMSASICPVEWRDFTRRGKDYDAIEWDEVMICDSGLDIWKLTFLNNILRLRTEQFTKTY